MIRIRYFAAVLVFLFSVLALSLSSEAAKLGKAKLKHWREANVLYRVYGPEGLEMNQPSDLDITVNGELYVLDGVNDRVLVFDSKGKYKFHFGRSGTGQGEFDQPLGIGLGKQGNVYVADSRNHRVQIFDPEGKYLNQIALRANPGSPLPDPTDVEVVAPPDEDETLWITDNDSHRIVIYDKFTLKYIKQFGSHGIEGGSFRYPFLMDSDESGRVYVVDVLNTRAQVFDSSGKFLREIGYWAISEGGFYRPKGIAHSPGEDTVYVSDSYLGVVQGFTPAGAYKYTVSDEHGREWRFTNPFGMVVDRFNRLYVIEMLANRVTVLQLK